MTTAIETMRTSLVTLLTAMTTAGGESISNVYPAMPTLAPETGAVEAWVTFDGYDALRRDGGFFGQVTFVWRWGVSLAIWHVDDPAAMAATENDFAQAVTDLLTAHIRGGVDPQATGVQILNQLPGELRAQTVDLDGSYFRLLEWKFALEHEATYTLTD